MKKFFPDKFEREELEREYAMISPLNLDCIVKYRELEFDQPHYEGNRLVSKNNAILTMDLIDGFELFDFFDFECSSRRQAPLPKTTGRRIEDAYGD